MILTFKVYHSNGGKIGNMMHVVDSDKYISKNLQMIQKLFLKFYSKFIDDGKTQPGCDTDECNHYFAAEVFIDQINGKKYPSFTCTTLEELNGK